MAPRALSVGLLAAALACAASGAPAAGRDAKVHWGTRSFAPDDAPAELPDGAREALATWAPWAAEHDFHLFLDERAQVLLLGGGSGSRTRHQLELVERTVALFEKSLPLPERDPGSEPLPGKPVASAPPPPNDDAGGDEPIPEDPEGGPAPWELYGKPRAEAPAQTEAGSHAWGSGEAPRDSQTAVFLVVKDEEAYGEVLRFLADGFPHLAEWARLEAPKFLGFSLQSPLAGGYVENAAGQEEWNPDSELVHRLAQLLLARRFGTLPNWLEQGWAWTCEMRLLKGIWCYPYRTEFVYTVEHTSWRTDLRNLMKDRRGKPLESEQLSGWRRGTWDGEAARLSWGVVDFLLREHAADVPRFVEELRLWRAEHDRVERPDGTWERDPRFVVPGEVQAELLERFFGADVLKKATSFLRKG